MKSVWLMLALGVTLAGMNHAHADETNSTTATSGSRASDDPFLWLEDIRGERSMAWVKQENARTAERFIGNAEFNRTRDRILEVLDSDARIPVVNRMGEFLYNFWRDKAHPRGVWRRTTLAEYRKAEPRLGSAAGHRRAEQGRGPALGVQGRRLPEARATIAA